MVFWDSVAALRKIEVLMILLSVGVPFFCGTVLFTVRHRIHHLLTRASETRGLSYQDNVERLENTNRLLSQDLKTAQGELSSLHRVLAPREISPAQEAVLLEKLSGVPGAPVILCSYALNEESAAYAEQLAGVLRKAGWSASLNRGSMNDFQGMTVGAVNLSGQKLPGSHELAQALLAASLDLRQVEVRPNSIAGRLEDGSLLVVVGRK
jgi:hypothetical protein